MSRTIMARLVHEVNEHKVDSIMYYIIVATHGHYASTHKLQLWYYNLLHPNIRSLLEEINVVEKLHIYTYKDVIIAFKKRERKDKKKEN